MVSGPLRGVAAWFSQVARLKHVVSNHSRCPVLKVIQDPLNHFRFISPCMKSLSEMATCTVGQRALLKCSPLHKIYRTLHDPGGSKVEKESH